MHLFLSPTFAVDRDWLPHWARGLPNMAPIAALVTGIVCLMVLWRVVASRRMEFHKTDAEVRDPPHSASAWRSPTALPCAGSGGGQSLNITMELKHEPKAADIVMQFGLPLRNCPTL